MEESEEDRANESTIKTQENEGILDKEFTIEEVVEALFALKSETAAGSDSILSRDLILLLETHIASENWKNVEIIKFLHLMLQSLWDGEKVPEDFKEIIIRPFLKSTDKDSTKPTNYRPVALLNVLMKIYEHIIGVRLVAYLEEKKILSNKQAAFRRGRSTADHIMIIQELFFLYRYKKGENRKLSDSRCTTYIWISKKHSTRSHEANCLKNYGKQEFKEKCSG